MLANGGISISGNFDQIEYQKSRADALNERPGELTGYDCAKCLNRGYNYHVGKNGEIGTRECECMIQRRNMGRIRRSGLEEAMNRYTFDLWECKEDWQQSAKDAALHYADCGKGGFLVYGQVGSGKTHICTAICAELMKSGNEVRYMLWRDVSVQAKARINNEDDYDEIVKPLKRVKVLYIDDFFKTGKGQSPTVADVNLAFEILNNRYNSRDSTMTIISTERTIQELLEIDEAVGSRIYDLCRDYILDFSGKKNWRLMK